MVKKKEIDSIKMLKIALMTEIENAGGAHTFLTVS